MTDDQYALIDGRLRHLPGGLEQYLQLVRSRPPTTAPASPSTDNRPPSARTNGSPHARRLRKQIVGLERSMARLTEAVVEIEGRLAVHDPLDYTGMADLAAEADRQRSELHRLEERWLTLSAEAEA